MEYKSVVAHVPASHLPTAAARLSVLAYLLCLAALAFDLWLIHTYPVIYWYDSYFRLADLDRIMIGRWLPGIQGLIFLAAKITHNLAVIRSLLALAATCVIASAYRLAARWFSPMTGLVAAALLATNLMFVALALVPYPDVLFVGFTLLALVYLDEPPASRRRYLGALMVNLACLTRYEGWLLSLVLIGESVVGPLRARNWGGAAGRGGRAALLYGLAPLGWIVFGVPAGAPYAILSRLNAIVAFETGLFNQPLAAQLRANLNGPELLKFAAQYGRLLVSQARPEILGLGIVGLLAAYRVSAKRRVYWRVLAFLCLDVLLAALLRGWNYGNLRQTFVVLVFLILYAAFGLEQSSRLLFRWLATLAKSPGLARRQGWALGGAATLVAAASAGAAVSFVAGASHQPDFYLPAQAGTWLKGRLAPDSWVFPLTDEVVQPQVFAVYAGLPLDRILVEDHFDRQAAEARLKSAGWVYVIELEKSRAGLSPDEQVLLGNLEAGRIAAQRVTGGPTRAWRLSAHAPIYPP